MRTLIATPGVPQHGIVRGDTGRVQPRRVALRAAGPAADAEQGWNVAFGCVGVVTVLILPVVQVGIIVLREGEGASLNFVVRAGARTDLFGNNEAERPRCKGPQLSQVRVACPRSCLVSTRTHRWHRAGRLSRRLVLPHGEEKGL
jgi:hypothetical protein